MKAFVWLFLGLSIFGCSGNKVSSEIKDKFKKVAFVSNYKDSLNIYTSSRAIWRADGSSGGLVGALVAEAVSGYDQEKLSSVPFNNINKHIQKYLDSYVKKNNYSFNVVSLATKEGATKEEVLSEAKKNKLSHVFILSPTMPANSVFPPEAGGILLSPGADLEDEESSVTRVSNFCSLELIEVTSGEVLKTVRCHEEFKSEDSSLVLMNKYSDYSDKDKKTLNSLILKKIRAQLKVTLTQLGL